MSLSIDYTEKIHELEASLHSRTAELQDLATMGAVITSIHEIDKVLSVVMDMALRLVNGEVGSILLEENSELTSKISWGIDEDFVKKLIYTYDVSLVEYAHETQSSVLIPDADHKNEDGIFIHTIMAIPIKTSKRCYGVLVAVNKTDESNFTEENKEVLEMLLSFVAVAIDNSILLQERLVQQKVEQEMQIAREVQETILPKDIAAISRVDIGTIYVPAREVSGDFYDVIKINDDQFFAIIGDVSSKGVPAALIMSATAGVIKAAISKDVNIEVSDLAICVNNILAEEIIKDRDMFITMFFSKINLEKNIMTYTNAGHLPGLFWDSNNKKIIELKDGGTIIGQFSGIPYKQGERELHSGDKLFLFTDGLTEAADKNSEIFGRDKVSELFEEHISLKANEFCETTKNIIDKFNIGCPEELMDDFTLMQIGIN